MISHKYPFMEFNMQLFLSKFKNKIDQKGRVSIPSQFRSILFQDGSQKMFCYPSLDAEAIDAGGSTLQDFRGVGGEDSIGYFSHNFAVYDRQGEECINSKCSAKIKRITQSNRSTFYCPNCQR